MKKLFYIVAICVTLGLISVYLSADLSPEPAATIEQVSVVEPAQEVEPSPSDFDNKNCQCDSECLCAEGETDCDCNRTKSTCTCTQEDGKIVTLESIETNNDDIEEENPEETSDEGESIITE